MSPSDYAHADKKENNTKNDSRTTGNLMLIYLLGNIAQSAAFDLVHECFRGNRLLIV